MQRRAVKGFAQINLPASPASVSSDEKSPSRLNQKSLGVTNRIWVILALFVFLVLFTRSVLPATEPSNPRHRFLHSELKPKNYLNFTDDHAMPFPFCPALGPTDQLAAKYEAVVLSTTRYHVGSGARIQRVIMKALSGLPVTISVIGGSVSACHGAGDDPLSPSCYPSRFFNWWNGVFPHPASELTNGAMRRTSSSYFGFCNAHHIPDMTDLVIVELDVEDANNGASMDEFELLIRSILIRPDSPAVLILGHFSPQIAHTNGFAGADHWHTLVAQYYDVPYISIKPVMYPKFINDPASISRYYADPILSSPAGHEVIADVLASYFQTQVCHAWATITGHSPEILPGPGAPIFADSKAKQPTDARALFGGIAQRKAAAPEAEWVDANDGGKAPGAEGGGAPALPKVSFPNVRVPAVRLGVRPADLEVRPHVEVAAYCVSANDLINPLPQSLFAGSGWQAFHPPPGSAEVSSHAHYFFSTLPTSKLRVNLQVGAGDIGVYYVREPASEVGAGSAVECWVDDNTPGAVVIENAAEVGEPTPTLQMIDHYVTRGTHYVECQLLGEEDDRNVPPFKIIGIFST